MSEIRNENQPTWADIEVALATEIVEESKKFQSTFPRGERPQIFTNILCFFMQ